MEEVNLLWFGIAFFLAVATYFSLSRQQKDVILERLHIRSRRFRSTDTPPRSLTPDTELSKIRLPPVSEYASVFPPSQRDKLPSIIAALPRDKRAAFGDLGFDDETFQKSILGWEEDYGTAHPSSYCYSGFSIREIKALGDFPDYTTLTEVPLPDPYVEFDIDKALPRPYRPFRWAYHQTMSLTKLETNWWLELENTYKARIAQRQQLYAAEGKGVLDWFPGSELACKELMEMCVQFLCARYPQYFTLSDDNTVLENKILNNKTKIKDKHPLLVLLDNVPEDFGIMLRNPDTGYYHFRAGMICSAMGWNVATKIGKQLHEIHAPIPDYKEKMQFSMDRFFTKMPASRPIQRGSWGLEVDQPLYMPQGHPHEKYREQQAPDVTLSRVHLRVDWQTLRRLPLSGAIVFNFKACFTPASEFRDEPYIPALMLKMMNEGKENLMAYKNTWHIEHACKRHFEEWKEEQEKNGLTEKDWQVRTLDESPWFPGWQEKWHRQQGF